LKQALVKDT